MGRLIQNDSLSREWTSEQCFIGEIVNQSQFPSISIAQALVKPGVTTQNHQIRNTLEVYYILKGTAEIYDQDSKYNLKSGDAYIWLPGESQQICNTGQEDLVFLCICTPRFEPKNYQAL